ncbi:Adenylate cyclase AcyA [Taphrina deformans PYCC 5710]|uniref:Adenylate cyclase n=1 Tax=Taphrina deformans (strain PYCC 5710 / ATCC 11124 / CBS 356.35 / IMI 108563 / JCM 9778 / NBRC 8474) TaxID=1097556 RepID=R4XJ65_TAPDE|nr:Adenylate cyclase AcyA [Taphrina deformans PYCC 5710]|eukprot:CCG83410.1 Adenylate cyclase AcyA [Taphrina deformans PYCC 5710]
MNGRSGHRPLDGDALRIQQLTAKLAQVQKDQSFLNPRAPGSHGFPGSASSSKHNAAVPRSIMGDKARTNSQISPRTTLDGSLPMMQHSFAEGEHSRISPSAQHHRLAPVIHSPSAANSATLSQDTSDSERFHTSYSHGSAANNHVNSGTKASVDIAPFMYSTSSNVPASTSATPTTRSELANTFDAVNGRRGSSSHVTSSSPLNPNKTNNALGPPLKLSRSRRDAADLGANAQIQRKQSRGFFNTLMGKKKRESSTASKEPTRAEAKLHQELFTSPFENANQQPRRPAYHTPSLSSLRIPQARRSDSHSEPSTMQRIKSSVISIDRSPGSSISTGGITLDTDMSRMTGIVGISQETALPKQDFTFGSRGDSTASATNEEFGDAAWAPPESWAVRRPEDIARDDALFDGPDPLDDPIPTAQPEKKISAATVSSEQQSKKGPNHQMRIFRGDWTFATVACHLQTTTDGLMTVLGRKFFLPSVANYQILIERNGLSRILQSWEKPFVLQKTLLEEAGYTEQDRLEEIGRDDNAYLCRFIFTTCSVPSFSVENDSSGAQFEHFDLSGRNVQTIPIVLYKHASTLRSLDVSRNLSLDIPIDFIQSCPQLTSIVCTHNETGRLPTNIVHARALMMLDVSFNRMTELHDQIDQLPNLVCLIARNNRLSKLPPTMSCLSNIKRLNLSSNSFTTFPKEICNLKNLEDLDLSFNRISAVPEAIGSLTKLKRLSINNNRLLGTLPHAFTKLTALREVDLRFNHLTTLDILSYCPMLESISAGHNAVTVVESQFPSARLFHLNKCPVTKFTLQTCGLTLTSLDLSNAKLPSIPDAMFDNLTNLIKLVLDNNHFTYLPPQLGRLTKLQHLSCTSNQLSVLPEELGELCELRVLDVHSNNLKTIPTSTWLLTGLISLNASSNLLTAFPEPPVQLVHKDSLPHNGLSPVVEEHVFTIVDEQRRDSVASIHTRSSNTMAQSLKYLFLGDNRMDEQCFESISLLQELRVLNLSFNELYEIPATALKRLHHLVELYLSGNELTSLPADDLEAMQTLRVLHVNANKLQTLPAEIGKIRKLLVLDVGSNALKYNTANWPYDWNWNWNLDLKYLNLSGNKRLEIKTNNSTSVRDRNLSDFNALTRLRVLGLMDITLTIDSVPEENEDRRVRLSGTDIANMSYGQADTLGRHDHLSTIDMVIPRFQGRDEEIVFGMFDGSEIQQGGSKVAKHLQDYFAEHIAIELKRLRKDEGVPAALRRAFLSYNKELGSSVTPIPVKKDSEAGGNMPGTQSHRPSIISQSSNTFAGPYIPVVLGSSDRTAGAAVCLVYLVGKRAYVANIGDSLAVLSKGDGTAKLLSVKHNAGAASEVQRIRQAGGFISRDGLVNDQLDVTRSMGYFNLTPLIQAAPHVETVDLTEEDEFIIIASKSLWEVMSTQTAVDIARSEREDLMLAAQKLRDFAITYGCPNKISVMIIGVGDLFHRKSKFMKMRNTSTGRGAAGGMLEEDMLLGHKSRRRAADDQPADSTLARLTREVPPPVGEVAMIFTDIKNSTLLWETHPVAMRSAIKIHNGIMRRQLRSIGGYEVKTEGDAFMVCFPTTTSALFWCFTVQTQLLVADWPQEILESADGRDIYDEDSGELIYRGISVRMGVHWGCPVCEVDPITRRMDYFGPMVNRAARISGVADGGQITISADVVRDLKQLEQLHQHYIEAVKAGKTFEDGAEEQAMLAVKKDMQMLNRVGFGISSLGERRLKGLENAEFISLAYPKNLSGRLTYAEKAAAATSGSVGPRAFDHRHIVDVYTVVFRLEHLCSLLRGNKQRAENRVNVLRAVIANAYSNQDDDTRLAAVLENLLTRVENSIAALTLHYSAKTTSMLVAKSGLQIHEIRQAIQMFKDQKVTEH